MKPIDRVLHILQQADYCGEPDSDRIRCQFQLAGQRSQIVEIRCVARTPDGLSIISFESRCQRLGAGFLRGLSGPQAVRLLELNARLAIGAFCIVDGDGEQCIAVRSTQILETMDDEELRTHCMVVAQLADQWEERIGRNEF
ncbi:MAG: YbjN domain-containing protein [Gemmatimonadetes bacterium]|nr:YbjN domain-containing protein [Gemmatimonadota bacterium]